MNHDTDDQRNHLVCGVYRVRIWNIRHVSLSAVEDEMILGILIGLFIGVNAGFLIAALCAAAGKGGE
jgi:Na+/H+ antiporter NhaA